MKYAENNEISHRQLYRQMILAFAAPFLLCLPGEGRLLGKSGIAGILAGVGVLALYGLFLRRLTPWYGDPVKRLGRSFAGIAGSFCAAYVILAAGYLLELMGRLVPSVLVTGIPGNVIIALSVLVCSYGAYRGMQRRGRMAEVSGGVLLGSLFLMMILCLGQSRGSYFREMAETSRLTGGELLRSFYLFVCAFSGISLLPFVLRDVEKRSSAGKPVLLGIFTMGGILVGMLLLLPAVLGWERLKTELFPVLPLLAGADLPGNVLARFDVLWMGFLLYSLLFAVGSLLHYGHLILDRTRLGNGRWWLPIAVYAAAVTEVRNVGIRQVFPDYLAYVFVPGTVLLQALMFLCGNKKRQKRAAAACVLCLLLLGMGGCAAIEPEKRMYPLALGVNASEEGVSLIYGMPELPEATGQEKPEESKSVNVLPIQGADFYEIEKIYDRSQEKYLDMSHIQVILMGDALLESNKWKEFLAYLKQEPFVGENVYLFRTADPGAVLSWDSGGTSIGEYLTGLLENRLPGQQKQGVTLRQVYHSWIRDGALEALPEIRLENERIQVYLEE